MRKDDDSKQFETAALRHAVFRELFLWLAPASIAQTIQFVSNLSLCRRELNKLKEPVCAIYIASRFEYMRILNLDAGVLFEKELIRRRDQVVENTMFRFRDLRVTPDIAEATSYRQFSRTKIEQALADKYSEALADVPGFYFSERWRLNLPEGCALYAYRSRLGFINGFLCQPLYAIDKYFLLSSSKYDGSKAVRLTPEDQQYFESFKEPPVTKAKLPSPDLQDDLSGMKWTGRRFVEKRSAA